MTISPSPEKRYQVFVSSTYSDLLDARAEVMQALLELDCMPAGMELFPAANEDQWNWIKRVISESDYYIVILAGRYGSVSEKTGQSYTEMEYRYALEIGKPVIGFVHEDPNQLPAKYYEANSDLREKLDRFRGLAQSRLCKYWSSPADLGAKVSRSLTQLIKQHPAVGWVRADIAAMENVHEVLKLRRQVDELQVKLDQIAIHGPGGTAGLAQGADKFTMTFSYERQQPKKSKSDSTYWVKAADDQDVIDISWDDIFAWIAPAFIEPIDSYSFVYVLNQLVEARSLAFLRKKFPGDRFLNFEINGEEYQTIKIQLRALGLIATKGENNSWVLTEYGDAYMNKLLAVHRKSPTTHSKGRGKTRRLA